MLKPQQDVLHKHYPAIIVQSFCITSHCSLKPILNILLLNAHFKVHLKNNILYPVESTITFFFVYRIAEHFPTIKTILYKPGYVSKQKIC